MSLYKRTATTAIALLTTTIGAQSFATDARSIALGGSAIANGLGVHGAMENPAVLARLKRDGQKYHFRFGITGEARDEAGAVDIFTDDENKTVLGDIEQEIDILSSSPITCNPLDLDPSQVCLTGTQAVADLSARLLDIIDSLDNNSGSATVAVNVGAALTGTRIPVAINFRAAGTGFVTPDISDSDQAYIAEFESLLSDDQLLLDEAVNSSFLQTSAFGLPLNVTQPEDILTSTGELHVLVRNEFSVNLARSFAIGGLNIDAGITPKFSSITTNNLVVSASEEFENTTSTAADRFDDSESDDTSFTFDIGGSMQLEKFPIRVAAVLRNVIPESITDDSGFEFETTPQLIVGGHMQKGIASLTADLALNEADVDNLETQRLAIGVEIGTPILALQAGINHDIARDYEATSLSLGAGLGPLQFGASLTGIESIEAGLQLSYSF